jgi:hypothetical protein
MTDPAATTNCNPSDRPRAIVLPADPSQPHRVIDWDPESPTGNLHVLYAEIGCGCIDSSPRGP